MSITGTSITTRRRRHLCASAALAFALAVIIPGGAQAHGFTQCGNGADVRVYRVSCNQAYKVIGHYIGSGFTDHERHGWKCRGAFSGGDGPGGLPGRPARRDESISCVRNSNSRGHQHIKASQ